MLPWWVWINHNDPRVAKETWSWPSLPNQLPNYKLSFKSLFCVEAEMHYCITLFFLSTRQLQSRIKIFNVRAEKEKIEIGTFSERWIIHQLCEILFCFLVQLSATFSGVTNCFPYDLVRWKKNLTKKVKATFLSSIACVSLPRGCKFQYLLLKNSACFPMKQASLEAKMPTVSWTPFWHSSTLYQ